MQISEQDFGRTGRDKITGFQGVITAVCRYISGCNQALLNPKVKEDGTGPEARWIDIQRLEVVETAPQITLDNSETPGSDVPAPIR